MCSAEDRNTLLLLSTPAALGSVGIRALWRSISSPTDRMLRHWLTVCGFAAFLAIHLSHGPFESGRATNVQRSREQSSQGNRARRKHVLYAYRVI
ncbi:hypothetical protein B0H17DRAFT_464705 [Mycena rosella]|uniref:Uncharacterized protein n=1 Tax=Mycena rosella TaxID=1033263 RepID=A0AAD7C9F8_MYCRO|nr:hypothetical protein B0H17DRAFT_464705 [Mycena rosella]